MYITCLDLEGVLVPEIWIAFAEETGIPELRLTTRDISDYDVLMKKRLGILEEHQLGLKSIQATIARIDPLPGAKEFLEAAKVIDMPVTVGMECRVSMKGTAMEGKRTNKIKKCVRKSHGDGSPLLHLTLGNMDQHRNESASAAMTTVYVDHCQLIRSEQIVTLLVCEQYIMDICLLNPDAVFRNNLFSFRSANLRLIKKDFPVVNGLSCGSDKVNKLTDLLVASIINRFDLLHSRRKAKPCGIQIRQLIDEIMRKPYAANLNSQIGKISCFQCPSI